MLLSSQFLPKTCGGNAELVPIQDAVVPSNSASAGESEAAGLTASQGKQADSQKLSNGAAEKTGTASLQTRLCLDKSFFQAARSINSQGSSILGVLRYKLSIDALQVQ